MLHLDGITDDGRKDDVIDNLLKLAVNVCTRRVDNNASN